MKQVYILMSIAGWVWTAVVGIVLLVKLRQEVQR
jgi:hypothetical protein